MNFAGDSLDNFSLLPSSVPLADLPGNLDLLPFFLGDFHVTCISVCLDVALVAGLDGDSELLIGDLDLVLGIFSACDI
jgi:hypothetical protein